MAAVQLFTRAMRGLRDREEGQTLVEYTLILFFVSITTVGVFGELSEKLVEVLGEVIAAL